MFALRGGVGKSVEEVQRRKSRRWKWLVGAEGFK